ncbi:hypothetical protein KDAU_22690 [Dictyobacter aurantiacus]|uniref:Uncharacterized protein n=1 Tax=Dictyobacter aurantiacus TaxID=1936993 RepID=A0A401ZDH9_9CHLR|nr:hypothetical protein KDAU_22690 [Dictyobacter aurantiacus]
MFYNVLLTLYHRFGPCAHPYVWIYIKREVQEGRRGPPAGAWGCPPQNSFFFSGAAAGGTTKERMPGETPGPPQGLVAPVNPTALRAKIL